MKSHCKKIISILTFSFLCVWLQACGQNWTFVLEGKVTDDIDNRPIHGATVKLSGSDSSILQIQTDSLGHYLFESKYIKKNVHYIISASGINIINKKTYRGYLGNPKKEFFPTDSIMSLSFIQNFKLSPILQHIQDAPIIPFFKNSSTLTKNSLDSLSVFIKIISENPNIIFAVEGHASNDENNPDSLSFERVARVITYLISQGIPKDMLVGKGYGNKISHGDNKENLFTATQRVSFTVLGRK